MEAASIFFRGAWPTLIFTFFFGFVFAERAGAKGCFAAPFGLGALLGAVFLTAVFLAGAFFLAGFLAGAAFFFADVFFAAVFPAARLFAVFFAAGCRRAGAFFFDTALVCFFLAAVFFAAAFRTPDALDRFALGRGFFAEGEVLAMDRFLSCRR